MKLNWITPFSQWLAVSLLSLAPLLASLNAFALDAAAPKPPGFGSHGMAVFGGVDGLYASHLPMFHAPHDVQLVFRFHLQDAATDAALRARLSAKPTLWTLDPEAFDLYRFAPQHPSPLTQFNARFIEGHFERGGKEAYTQQRVMVDEVLIYQRLSLARRSETAGQYLKIGTKSEQFLIKRIDRRPDFDLIIALKATPGAIEKPAAKRVTVPSVDLKQPTLTLVEAALDAQGAGHYQAISIIYFETDDLK